MTEDKRPIAIEDIFELRVPTDVQIAPDGRSLVWVERWADHDSGEAYSQLVRLREGEAPRPFTAEGRLDSAPRISPDGRQVAFLRTPVGEGDGPAKTSLCVIPMDGGEARVLVKERGAFGAPAWSPDGRWLVVPFRRADPLPEGEKQLLSIRVKRLHYKLDGAGYLPSDRFSLYKLDTAAESPELVALTDADGDWDDAQPVWSPDGGRIAFISNRRPERDRDTEAGDVFVVSSEGGEPVQCTHRRAMMAAPAWAPDGRWLAVIGCVAPPGQPLFRKNVELYRVDATGEDEEVSLTAHFDRSVMNLTIDDLWGLEHWVQRPVVAPDGRSVVVPIADQGTTWLGAVRLDENGAPTGKIDRLVDDRVVVCYDAAPDAQRFVLLTSTPSQPGQIERVELDAGCRNLARRQVLAWPLQSYCESRRLTSPIELRVDGPEGHSVHGWLLLPEGEGPFPLLLDIHGGPVVQFGRSFFHELQTFAARGYAVLFVNPRGSQGYGEDYVAAIHRDWGTPAMADVMLALDAVLADYADVIDAERLGIVGGSYGGYLTTWIIAHTHRFKAACVQRTVSSMEAMIWDDFGAEMGYELDAFHWEDPELYTRLSPITYVRAIQTPVLILQGLADQRTPADQGERLFVTLRLLGKEAEMVLFPGGTHDLSRNGRPRQRVERLRVIHEFFDRHLGSS